MNKHVLFEFGFALGLRELNKAATYLADDGRFFKNYDKSRTIVFLMKLLSPFKKFEVGCSVDEVISLDYYPGCTAMKIYIVQSPPEQEEEDELLSELRNGKNQSMTLYLVPVLKDGKIIDLQFVKNYVLKTDLEEMAVRN